MSKTPGGKCRVCRLYLHPRCPDCGLKMNHYQAKAGRKFTGWICPQGHRRDKAA